MSKIAVEIYRDEKGIYMLGNDYVNYRTSSSSAWFQEGYVHKSFVSKVALKKLEAQYAQYPSTSEMPPASKFVNCFVDETKLDLEV